MPSSCIVFLLHYQLKISHKNRNCKRNPKTISVLQMHWAPGRQELLILPGLCFKIIALKYWKSVTIWWNQFVCSGMNSTNARILLYYVFSITYKYRSSLWNKRVNQLPGYYWHHQGSCILPGIWMLRTPMLMFIRRLLLTPFCKPKSRACCNYWPQK